MRTKIRRRVCSEIRNTRKHCDEPGIIFRTILQNNQLKVVFLKKYFYYQALAFFLSNDMPQLLKFCINPLL